MQILLGDAQTSGGLLLCVPEDRADEAVRRLHDAGCERAAAIGRPSEGGGGGARDPGSGNARAPYLSTLVMSRYCESVHR